MAVSYTHLDVYKRQTGKIPALHAIRLAALAEINCPVSVVAAPELGAMSISVPVAS